MIGTVLMAALSLTQADSASLDNALDASLGVAGLNRSTARFDLGLMDVYREGSFASPFSEAAIRDPWRVPFLADIVRNEITLNAGQPWKTLSSVARLTGNAPRRDLIGNPAQPAIDAAQSPSSLGVALQKMARRGLIPGTPPPLDGVPVDVQRAAALVIEAALEVEPMRAAALFGLDPDAAYRRETTPGATDDPLSYRTAMAFMERVQMSYLFAMGQDTVAGAMAASDLVANVPADRAYEWRMSTAWGEIVLSGGKDDNHTNPRTFLIIDTGGNDTYLNLPANSAADQPFSIVIDAHGSDAYVSDAGLTGKPVREATTRASGRGRVGPGCAVLGVVVLVDRRGNDLYRSARSSFGSATFGTSYLYDADGDDIYDVYADSLGYGKFGLGVVEDVAGNDRYFGFTQMQGCGLVGGVGLLIDRAGNDRYEAETKVIDFPSPQTTAQNVTMGQGAGTGLRMDFINGRSLAGGTGILFDLRGEDRYVGAVFAQGVGYWRGVGMLWDGDGKDEYSAQWYAQGAAAHFAVGYLHDAGGDDTYRVFMNMGPAAGHDFSVGMLLESSGNDLYSAGNLSLGAGNANGIGALLEMNGNDTYETQGPLALGRASEAPTGTFRERALTLGFLFDAAGQDTYPARFPRARNGARELNVTVQRPLATESQLGVFFDR